MPLRLLLGRPPGQWYFGEDPRCEAVWVQRPDELPSFVRAKGRQINFFTHPAGRELALQLLPTHEELRLPPGTVIVATSPLDTLDAVSKKQKVALFAMLTDHLQELGFAVRVKPHPRENPADYAQLGDKLLNATAKLPLEVFVLTNPKPLTLVSPYSSAGIGMEDLLRPVQLLSDPADLNKTVREIHAWLKDPELFHRRIADLTGSNRLETG